MEPPSTLEAAVIVLMDVFKKYAGLDGCKKTLSKAEVKTLIENEFPDFVQVGGEQEQTKQMMMDLITYGTQEVTFRDFIFNVACLTIDCKPWIQAELQSSK